MRKKKQADRKKEQAKYKQNGEDQVEGVFDSQFYVEVWNCGKISLILFCTQKEQADRKKEQAMYKRNGEKDQPDPFFAQKGAGR